MLEPAPVYQELKPAFIICFYFLWGEMLCPGRDWLKFIAPFLPKSQGKLSDISKAQ